MNYEIVNLDEKKLVGIGMKTKNDDPKVGEKIGGLWTRVFQEDIYNKINNRNSDYPICLYSDYTNTDVSGYELEYDITIGFTVDEMKNSEYIVKTIPKGKYAKFSVRGNVATATMEVWDKVWNMNLNRSYTGDFEEYLNNSMDDAEIAIYIALK